MSIPESRIISSQDRGTNAHRRDIGMTFKKEAGFPTDVDGRMEAILSSFNATPRAVVQLLLRQSMTDKAPLAHMFKDVMADSGMEEVTPEIAIFSYCQTLCSIGLVVAETVDYFGREKIVGYSLTQASMQYGRPTAAFFLEFERFNGFSLFPVFGSINLARGEHRAPFSRAAIIKALEKVDKREIDLVRELRMKQPAVRSALDGLAQAGIIEYSSIKSQTGKEQVDFTLGSKPIFEAKTINKEKVLTKEVAIAIDVLASQEIPITQANVYNVLPERFRENLGRNAVAQRISSILSNLGKNGYLVRGKYERHKAFSNARLTEKGRIVLNKLIFPLEDACADGATLDKLREEVMPRVISHLSEYARTSADLYYPFSMSFKIKNRAERIGKIKEMLEKDKKIGTARDFADELDEKIPTVSLILRGLVGNNFAARVKDNGVYYYFAKRDAGTAS